MALSSIASVMRWSVAVAVVLNTLHTLWLLLWLCEYKISQETHTYKTYKAYKIVLGHKIVGFTVITFTSFRSGIDNGILKCLLVTSFT